MRVRACAALFMVLLTAAAGCADSSGPQPSAAPNQVGEPWHDEIQPPSSAGSVGGPTTACPLPVSFDLAASWRAKAVRLDGNPLDELAKQGDATMACEIDAKPAGHIGFLRIWTAPRSGAPSRATVEGFLTATGKINDVQYRDTTAGKLPAVEATYLRDSELTGDRKRERVLAVETSDGVVLLSLSGLDNDEYLAMLPAYALARSSLTPSG